MTATDHAFAAGWHEPEPERPAPPTGTTRITGTMPVTIDGCSCWICRIDREFAPGHAHGGGGR